MLILVKGLQRYQMLKLGVKRISADSADPGVHRFEPG